MDMTSVNRPGRDGAAEEAARRPRLLIADDHAELRSAVCLLLADEAIDVVAEAADGRAAVEAALRWKPDVVLTDVSMPNLDGLEASARILAELPRARLVVHTASVDPALPERCSELGVFALLHKGVSPDILVRTLRQAAAGTALRSADGEEGLPGAPT